MPIAVECQCGAKLKAKDELAGKRLACPKCKQPVLIQAAPSAPVDDDPLGLGDLGEPAASASPAPLQPPANQGFPVGQSAPHAAPGFHQAQPGAGAVSPGSAQPTPKGDGKSSKTLLIAAIAGGAFLVLLLVGGGVGALMMMGGNEDTSSSGDVASAGGSNVNANAGNNLPLIDDEPMPDPSRAGGGSANGNSPGVSPGASSDTGLGDSLSGLDPNVLRRIGRANNEFQDTFTHYPTANSNGKKGSPTGLSWRVHLLPFLGEEALYDQFHLDEPWNSDHNIALVAQMPDCYKVPGVPAGKTTIEAFVGQEPNSGQFTTFGGESGVSIGRVTDGTSATIYAAIGNDEIAIEWTRPGGIEFNSAAPFAQVKAFGDSYVAFRFDGTVCLIPTTTSNQDLANYIWHRDGVNPSAFPQSWK